MAGSGASPQTIRALASDTDLDYSLYHPGPPSGAASQAMGFTDPNQGAGVAKQFIEQTMSQDQRDALLRQQKAEEQRKYLEYKQRRR